LAYAQLSPSSWNKKKHLATLYDVCVRSDQRRKSVGSTLLKFVILETKKVKTLEKIHLFVTSENITASKFYERLGFAKTAIIPKSVKEKDSSYQDEYLYILDLG